MGTKYTWLFAGLGSFIGSLIPKLWGAGLFSLWGVLFGALGALAGIWVAFKVSQM